MHSYPPPPFLVKNNSADPSAVWEPVPPAVLSPGSVSAQPVSHHHVSHPQKADTRPAHSPTSNISKHLLQPRITWWGGGVSHGLEFFKVGQQTTAHACTHSPPHWPHLPPHTSQAQGRKGCLRDHTCQQLCLQGHGVVWDARWEWWCGGIGQR